MPTLSVIQYKQIEEIIARQGQLMATYATEATGTTIFSNVPTAPYGLNRAPLFDNHAQFLQSGSQEPETSGWHSQEHVSKPLQHTELMPSNPEQTHMQLLLQQCNYYCNVQETRSKPEDFFSSTAHFEVDHRSTDVDSLAQKEDVNTHAYYSFFPPSTPNRMNPHRIFDENHIRTPTSASKRTRIEDVTEIPKKVARALHDATIPMRLRIRELSDGEDVSGLEENDNYLVTLPEDDDTGDSNHFCSWTPEDCTCGDSMPWLQSQNYDASGFSLYDV
ncbi:hypothetical protein L5515_017717 [Caenorhabditis briggsae]|uniref:Uncharacterized protein n=1 Tax=Caenorhabditis briggsae TaxID=6238 RepID=A0AAE9JRA4_CAEBR|nr:hypothetical protein L5515_017717 [Caenorhabditis briggsae]